MNQANYKKTSRRAGFTFPEILFTLVIFCGVVFSIASLRNNLNILENVVGQKMQSRADIDQALQIMTTEIRSASPSTLGAYPIESANSSSIAFFADSDRDGLYERIRYFFGTSTLSRGVVVPSGNPLSYNTSSETVTTVIEHIIASSSIPIFQYYDDTFTGVELPLASPINVSAIRIVKFKVYTDINPSRSPLPIYFSSTINIRNLRDN